MPVCPQKEAHEVEENWAPLSVVTVSGTPKRATHEDKKALMQEAAEASLRGVASNHLVVLSITVKRYRKPSSEAGSGPTRSTCTCENLLEGI
jgi:hypothetical protein